VEGLSTTDSPPLFTCLARGLPCENADFPVPPNAYLEGSEYGLEGGYAGAGDIPHWLLSDGAVWVLLRWCFADQYQHVYEVGHYKFALLYSYASLVTDENTGYSLKLDWHGISPQEGVRGWEIWRRKAPPSAAI